MNDPSPQRRRNGHLALLALLLACAGLAACQPQTNVSATGNAPAQYSHVFLTVKEVDFNTSATATSADSGWQKFALSAPQTIDLAALSNGSLAQFAGSLSLPAGKYAQMRIVLADPSASLASSAQSAGARFNDEADYTDSSGTLHQVPLDVPNAAQGIGFPVSLTVQSSQQASVGAIACAISAGSAGSAYGAGSMYGSPYAGGSMYGSPYGTGSTYGSPYGTGSLYGSPYGMSSGYGSTLGFGFGLGLGSNCAQYASQYGYGSSLYGTGYPYGTSYAYGSGYSYGTGYPYGTGYAGTTYPYGTTGNCAAGMTYDSTTGTCVSTFATGTTGACAAGTTYNSTTGTCVSSYGGYGSGYGGYGSTCGYGQIYNSSTGSCSSTLTSAATTNAAVDFDAARDLAAYTVSGQSGFLLIPRPAAYDLSQTGTIQGQIGIAALSSGTGGIEVTAETLSADGSRHVAVESAPLRSDGSFILYPLSTASGAATQYDLVIHGPGVGTVIIKSVPVTAGGPSSATALSLANIALVAATRYSVNVSPNSPVAPAGARIGFYQTIPASGEVPYLIETRRIDPFTGTFDTAQQLSAARLSYGTYASGSTALTTATPSEGVSSYHVAASAPVYGEGPLSTTVAPATSGTATFTVAALRLPSGASAASVAGTISVAAPGKYDKGELLLTQNGALVAVAPLDAYLASSQTAATLFSNVPGGSGSSTFSNGLYYAEAWVWSSADPAGTLSRQPQSAPIDLRGGSASGITISIE